MLDALNVILSRVFGYMSIGTWIIVFVPQLYENYQRGNAESLSIHFLLLWVVGDIFNLLGSVFQDVLLTTILLSFYFVLFDVLMIGQYIYYYRKNHYAQPVEAGSTESSPLLKPPTTASEATPLLLPETAVSASRTSTLVAEPTTTSGSQPAKSPEAARSQWLLPLGLALLAVSCCWGVYYYYTSAVPATQPPSELPATPHPPLPGHGNPPQFRLFAQFCAWTSVVLYIGARIPQIVKNYRSKSCEGLALTMFVFCVVGNSTFCLSILCYSLEPRHLLVNLPWMLGSAGTLAFDFTIFYQFYVYTHRPAKKAAAAAAAAAAVTNGNVGESTEPSMVEVV
ncbi:PQ loop repeat-domain-containing protein [Dimargaris cristalligena]|uniref:PQ loop repeat-domain-containing protein n=1 Tax=Dimargaris cristalligena TaxID=215637 RepID=A0A4P9ZQU0_9FUNG|nr:PQ loop repeat-domain-containing protein [Dimargaris cristalligena]|eukprot:RKP35498.1 PQ loop repeat-domain-containing protein [Dimargaris cristalligena]